MSQNKMLRKLRAGQASLGCFLNLESASVAEMLGEAGFDWLMVQAEHNAMDMAQIQELLRAIGNTEAVPLVRIPSLDPVFIQRALDVGAQGVMVPLIRTAEEARRVVEATRYPPRGKRSWGGMRNTRYTFAGKEYFKQSDENIAVILIIETAEALENIDAIAAEPGVDALMLGPADLALSLGLDPFAQSSPELAAACDRVLEAGKEHQVAVGIVYGAAEKMQERAEQGYQLLAISDVNLLASKVREFLAALQDV